MACLIASLIRYTAHAASHAALAMGPAGAPETALGQIWRDRISLPLRGTSTRAAGFVRRSGVVDVLCHGGALSALDDA